MTPWQWWAGSYGGVEYEGAYELGDFPSRDAAIAAGREEWPGDVFYVVEARCSTAKRVREGDDVIPFVAMRNQAEIEPLAGSGRLHFNG